jgi:hypothetical protein
VEAAWYAWWEKSGFFKPEYGRKSVKDIPEVGKMYTKTDGKKRGTLAIVYNCFF